MSHPSLGDVPANPAVSRGVHKSISASAFGANGLALTAFLALRIMAITTVISRRTGMAGFRPTIAVIGSWWRVA